MREQALTDPTVFGYVPGEPTAKDYLYDASLPHAAPPAYTHPSFQNVPVMSQQGGTCVGNSIAAALMGLQYVETGEVVGFNGEELNARVTHREGDATSFKPVMDDLLKSGIREGAAGRDGLYFPEAYANVDYTNVEAVKQAISTPGQAVVFATFLLDGPTGFGSNPKQFLRPDAGPRGGLHAMWAPAYTAEGLIAQNSWDRWFGDGGFVRLSWDYVVQHFVEVMAITDRPDVAGGYVKTYEFPDPTWERAVKRPGKPAVYLVKGNGRVWIKDPWEAKRFGVNLAAVEQVPSTDKIWALPVTGPDAPRDLR